VIYILYLYRTNDWISCKLIDLFIEQTPTCNGRYSTGLMKYKITLNCMKYDISGRRVYELRSTFFFALFKKIYIYITGGVKVTISRSLE
jgi:hypothetical protein